MGAEVPLVNIAPTLSLLAGAGLAAAAVLGYLAWRQRRQGARAWMAALTTLTLVLTFDLIVFGSFTRLTDSGLGCPDWPGCYGAASPLGAAKEIAQAQAAMPTGPVTFPKAWIEMIHRYLAMTVGALILSLAVAGFVKRQTLPHSVWLPFATLVWVIVQGLFGKYTVTLKLYPAIVSLHLLGGMLLLALLTVQHVRWNPRPLATSTSTQLVLAATIVALWVQMALGGWVSTNYAVLACTGFPQCNGQWWPDMALAEGFQVLRPLGHRADGSLISFDALVGIHMVHRLFALVLLALLAVLAWRLWRENGSRSMRPAGLVAGLAAWQVLSGLSNVVLGWPLVAALAHSAGAAALVAVTTALWARGKPVAASQAVEQPRTAHRAT
jgi:cytochrome c oxidase assembly protein subunit 15